MERQGEGRQDLLLLRAKRTYCSEIASRQSKQPLKGGAFTLVKRTTGPARDGKHGGHRLRAAHVRPQCLLAVDLSSSACRCRVVFEDNNKKIPVFKVHSSDEVNARSIEGRQMSKVDMLFGAKNRLTIFQGGCTDSTITQQRVFRWVNVASKPCEAGSSVEAGATLTHRNYEVEGIKDGTITTYTSSKPIRTCCTIFCRWLRRKRVTPMAAYPCHSAVTIRV